VDVGRDRVARTRLYRAGRRLRTLPGFSLLTSSTSRHVTFEADGNTIAVTRTGSQHGRRSIRVGPVGGPVRRIDLCDSAADPEQVYPTAGRLVLHAPLGSGCRLGRWRVVRPGSPMTRRHLGLAVFARIWDTAWPYAAYYEETGDDLRVFAGVRDLRTGRTVAGLERYPEPFAGMAVRSDGAALIARANNDNSCAGTSLVLPGALVVRELPYSSCEGMIGFDGDRVLFAAPEGPRLPKRVLLGDVDGRPPVVISDGVFGSFATANYADGRLAYRQRSCTGRDRIVVEDVASAARVGPRRARPCSARVEAVGPSPDTHGTVRARIACPLGCRGIARIAPEPYFLAHDQVGRFRLPARGSAVVEIRLGRSGVREIRQNGPISTRILAAVRQPDGRLTTYSGPVTLSAP
jgi:hypothetical protein